MDIPNAFGCNGNGALSELWRLHAHEVSDAKSDYLPGHNDTHCLKASLLRQASALPKMPAGLLNFVTGLPEQPGVSVGFQRDPWASTNSPA